MEAFVEGDARTLKQLTLHTHTRTIAQSEQKIRGQIGSADPSLPFQAFSLLLFTASKRTL